MLYVTSTNRHTSLHRKFVEKVENVRIQNGRPSRSLKSKKEAHTTKKTTPPDPEEKKEHPHGMRRQEDRGNCVISPENCMLY